MKHIYVVLITLVGLSLSSLSTAGETLIISATDPNPVGSITSYITYMDGNPLCASPTLPVVCVAVPLTYGVKHDITIAAQNPLMISEQSAPYSFTLPWPTLVPLTGANATVKRN